MCVLTKQLLYSILGENGQRESRWKRFLLTTPTKLDILNSVLSLLATEREQVGGSAGLLGSTPKAC